MSQPERIVIIGASLAGGSAALALREQGYAGELTLIGEEPQLPYERPPLSKGLLQGATDEPDWVGTPSFWADDVRLLRGVVATRIDRARKVVVAGGAEHPYDKLLIATGSTPRRIDLPGADLAGIRTLRTLDEALVLRSDLAAGARLVVIGAGWIGCEVAASARTRDVDVTMVEPASQPLLRVVGEQIGSVFADLHRERGVDLRLGTGVVGFGGSHGRVSEVRLAGGVTIGADLVLVGVGVIPNVALADLAGLDLAAGGIAVDAELRTSDPDIYAVGDVAAEAHPAYRERVRVEHWANAQDQGRHVAANLLGAAEPYLARPFFFSDQYDLGCEYRGLADPSHDQLVVRGDLAARDFTAFWLRDGKVAAAMNVNQWDDGDLLSNLVDNALPLPD